MMDRVEHLRDMVERLRGRARFLRNRKEIKSPKLMEHAADEVERLHEELVAAQAVIDQMREIFMETRMSERQPVETAPRDGTFVLLSGHDLPVWQGSWVGTSGRYVINGWTRFNSVDINWNPTHWKPLPEPPSGT